jgi:hypothetical protein
LRFIKQKKRMKSIFSTLLIAGLLVFSACNETESTNTEGSDNLRTSSDVMGTSPAASNTGGVQHYICANNCAGSGGPSAGTCPICGAEYIHNDAFHAQDASQEQPQITLGDQNNTNAATPPPTEPAQNAKGVWHYTCASGCAGGGGAPGSCASCGGALQHNDAYHL